jgi:ribosomal protein L1
MPSALRASRDFAARAIARVRSGVGSYGKTLGQEGPEIKVEPFDATNVSTPAALIKLGTSISAARRHQANFAASQSDAALAREKVQAEIAQLRAEAQYNLGQGRKTGVTPTRSERPITIGGTTFPAGTLQTDLNAAIAQENAASRAGAATARAHGASAITAAKAGIANVDTAIERDTAKAVAQKMADYRNAIVPRIGNTSSLTLPDGTKTTAHAYALDALGIDAKQFDSNQFGQANVAQKQGMLNTAFDRLQKRVEPALRARIQRYYAPQRDKYQAVIDNAIQNATSPEGDQTGAAADELNPLGLDLSAPTGGE